jgi:hypothetical protein
METFGIIKAGDGVVAAAGSFDQLTVASGTAFQFRKTPEDVDILLLCEKRGYECFRQW